MANQAESYFLVPFIRSLRSDKNASRNPLQIIAVTLGEHGATSTAGGGSTFVPQKVALSSSGRCATNPPKESPLSCPSLRDHGHMTSTHRGEGVQE